MNDNPGKRTRIAIPTNDGIHIFPKMLGMAKALFIYEIANRERFRFVDKRDNPYANTLQHSKTLDVYDLIDDCSVIVSAHIGKKGIKRLEERGMKLIFKKGKIEQALDELSNN